MRPSHSGSYSREVGVSQHFIHFIEEKFLPETSSRQYTQGKEYTLTAEKDKISMKEEFVMNTDI